MAVELARRLEQTGVKLRGLLSAEAERVAAVPDVGQLAAWRPRSGPRRSGSTRTGPCPALSSGAKVQDFHAHESVNSPRAVADKIGVPHELFDSPR